MLDILVIGLAGRTPTSDWSSLLAGRAVVARCGNAASTALPSDTVIAATYDAAFELVAPEQIAATVSDAVASLAQQEPVAYLTPGLGTLGDAIVDRMRENGLPLSLSIGVARNSYGLSGPVSILDALDLAAAETREPFIGNLPALDSTGSLLVTNWYGGHIIELATRRIRRRYPDFHPFTPDPEGFLRVPAVDPLDAGHSLAALEHIVARLRREDGCPWDREQTTKTLLPALAEETDELRRAIEQDDTQNIIEEMGDVLVNLLMQAQIASEAGQFRFHDAVDAAARKLVRRHPHVFGDAQATSAEDVLSIWQQVKAREAAERLGTPSV